MRTEHVPCLPLPPSQPLCALLRMPQAAEAWEYAQKWNNSVIDDIFGGLLQSTVVCSACQHPSNCFDKFLDLSIPIPSRSGCSIDECLGSFTEVEKLGKVDGYRCENCKCVVSATKQLQIYYLPKVGYPPPPPPPCACPWCHLLCKQTPPSYEHVKWHGAHVAQYS